MHVNSGNKPATDVFEMSEAKEALVDLSGNLILHSDTKFELSSENVGFLPNDPMDWIDLEYIRRQIFAKPTEEITEFLVDPYLELYNIFGDSENVFEDYEVLSPETEKCLLFKESRNYNSQCTVSMSEFDKNWSDMTNRVFEGVDLSNCFIAGGCVLGCLLPNYSATTLGGFGSSDIDIFIYGLNESDARLRLIELIKNIISRRQCVARELNITIPDPVIMHTKHTVTILGTNGGFRPVQIILRLYRSPSEILLGFDIDCCCVGYDNEGVWASPRAWRAIVTRCNSVDLTRRSPSYERRLEKYATRGFAIFVGSNFNINMVNQCRLFSHTSYNGARGLVYLIQKSLLKNIPNSESRDRGMVKRPTSWSECDYIQYARCFDFTTVEKEDIKKLFTSILTNELVYKREYFSGDDNNSDKIILHLLSADRIDLFSQELDELAWVTKNPGCQSNLMTGSFHPMLDGDWVQSSVWRKNIDEIASHALFLKKKTNLLEVLNNEGNNVVPPLDPRVCGLEAEFCVNFFIDGILKVKSQVGPTSPPLSLGALKLVKILLSSIMKRIALESLRLLKYERTITSRHIQSSVRMILYKELAKHAVSEGTKAVTKFTSAS
jgi:hypothetical protein